MTPAIRASVIVEENKDAAAATRDGTDRYVMDMAGQGFEQSQDIIAREATDTGTLLQSGVPPYRERGGDVVWGYNAAYAEPVEEGAAPHWAPIGPLKRWAKRVLGDASLGYAVQQKIAQEGTEGVHYAARSVETMKAWASSRDWGGFIVERL